ncbi:hypothetical protein AB0M50_12900 [Nonomuraea fuscirosea]|uniref:hypothetical protein n=1 Tax=Nonomuraea fuscirosea TaxID=1291556 RepID=UPI00341B7CEF
MIGFAQDQRRPEKRRHRREGRHRLRRPASVERALAELPDNAAGLTADASSPEDLARFFDQIGPFDRFAYTTAENLTSVPLAEYTAELPVGQPLRHLEPPAQGC